MKFHRSKGFTLIELLVVISIIAILASLAVPAVTSAMVKGQLIQTLNNSRQIHLACFSMASDASANSDYTMGWPADATGTSGGGTAGISSLATYVDLLVGGGYIRGEDIKKVFSAPGVNLSAVSGSGTTLTGFSNTTSAFSMNQIGESSQSNALFLCTKNFNPTSPNDFATTTVQPYQTKGFVICRKGGDAGIYKTSASGTASYSGTVNLMN